MTVSSRRRLTALVTRPRAEAGALAAALAERGIDALIEPLIDIRYHDGPCPGFVDVQAVLFTSANGVRALARLTAAREVPVFAVGDATAAQAREEGFAAVESAGGNAADLARLIEARLDPRRGRLIHIAGREVAGDLAGSLRESGFSIDRAVLYEAVAASSLSPAVHSALRKRAIDFVLFFSPRTAAIFARLAREGDIDDVLAEVAAVSISAAADAAVAELSFRHRTIAAAPTQRALLTAVDGLLAGAVPEAAR